MFLRYDYLKICLWKTGHVVYKHLKVRGGVDCGNAMSLIVDILNLRFIRQLDVHVQQILAWEKDACEYRRTLVNGRWAGTRTGKMKGG